MSSTRAKSPPSLACPCHPWRKHRRRQAKPTGSVALLLEVAAQSLDEGNVSKYAACG